MYVRNITVPDNGYTYFSKNDNAIIHIQYVSEATKKEVMKHFSLFKKCLADHKLTTTNRKLCSVIDSSKTELGYMLMVSCPIKSIDNAALLYLNKLLNYNNQKDENKTPDLLDQVISVRTRYGKAMEKFLSKCRCI